MNERENYYFIEDEIQLFIKKDGRSEILFISKKKFHLTSARVLPIICDSIRSGSNFKKRKNFGIIPDHFQLFPWYLLVTKYTDIFILCLWVTS